MNNPAEKTRWMQQNANRILLHPLFMNLNI